MQVVVLAGGLGTRLWPLTKTVPKPMVPVRGVPYLEHQLRAFARQSLRDVVLLTGYLGEQIEEYFSDGARLGLRLRYCRERQPLGTGGALREAGELLDQLFLVVYGDSFLSIDYASAGRFLADRGATGLVVVHHDSEGATGVAPNIALDADGYVTRYDKQAAGDPGLTHIESGVLAFRREVLDHIPPEGVCSLEQQVYPRLIDRRELVGLATEQRFFDIGTPERLRVIERMMEAERASGHPQR
jgi:mannose-1-phosphate guanylyltransferase